MEQYVSIETYKQVCMERDIAIEQLRQLGYEFGENTRRKIKDEDRISDEMAIKILNNISYVLDNGSKVKKAYNQGIEALQERIANEKIIDKIRKINYKLNEAKQSAQNESNYSYNRGQLDLINQLEEVLYDDLDFIQKHPSIPIKISIPSNDEISNSLVGFCKGIIAAEESKENKND